MAYSGWNKRLAVAESKLVANLRTTPMKLVPIKRIIGVLSIFPVLAWAALGQNGLKLSKDQVVAALNSIDRGLTNRNAAAVVANFATNAGMTTDEAKTFVEEKLGSTKSEQEFNFDYCSRRCEAQIRRTLAKTSDNDFKLTVQYLGDLLSKLLDDRFPPLPSQNSNATAANSR